mmetsp:Transcript_12089/g.28562  ORF Transcript_12089/g.28562 Transcript_12089/m.28562 type:complete len:212 (-) Transcript_12089:1762-2397(-)
MEPVWPKPPLCVAGPPMPRMSCGPLMPRMSGGAPAPPPIVSIGPMLTPAGIPLMVSIGPMPPPPPSLSRRRFWTPLLAAALACSEFIVEEAANCTPNPRALAIVSAPAANSGLAKSRNPTIVFFLSSPSSSTSCFLPTHMETRLKAGVLEDLIHPAGEDAAGIPITIAWEDVDGNSTDDSDGWTERTPIWLARPLPQRCEPCGVVCDSTAH